MIDTSPKSNLPPLTKIRIFFYIGGLIILLTLGAPSGGLVGIPIFIFMKNKMHLEAHEIATFRFFAAIPLYLSFAVGFVRDRWSPFGMGDRGLIIIFGAITAGLYSLIAFIPLNYLTLLIGLMFLKIAYLFITSAQNGLTSVISQQHLMSGQMSAAWNVFLTLCNIIVLLIGGYFVTVSETWDNDASLRLLFLFGAVAMVLMATYGLWHPKSVFDNIAPEPEKDLHAIDGLKRLFRHKPIYPALIIWFLWNFQPGSDTSLLYFLQNRFRADSGLWQEWNAVNGLSFIPTFLLFGFISRTYSLKTLMFWGTIAAIPQWTPLLTINSVPGALLAAVPIGLLGGVATASYLALIIRSCPSALQGTTLMMAGGVSVFSARFGDVLGTELYDHYGGFMPCVIAMAFVYALILPISWTIPGHLVDCPDENK